MSQTDYIEKFKIFLSSRGMNKQNKQSTSQGEQYAG